MKARGKGRRRCETQKSSRLECAGRGAGTPRVLPSWQGPGHICNWLQVPKDQSCVSKEDSGIWVEQGPEGGNLWAPAGEV